MTVRSIGRLPGSWGADAREGWAEVDVEGPIVVDIAPLGRCTPLDSLGGG